MTTARCVMCGRNRPMRKVCASVEDGDRVHLCRDSRPCSIAFGLREIRWARRMLSQVPRDQHVRAFKNRHARFVALWRRTP